MNRRPQLRKILIPLSRNPISLAGSALMLITFLLSAAIIAGIYLLFRQRGYTADV